MSACRRMVSTFVKSAQCEVKAPQAAASTGVVDGDVGKASLHEWSIDMTKPRARGWIHFYSALVSVVAGFALLYRLIRYHSVEPVAIFATSIYVAALIMLFTISACYHIINWKEPHRRLLMKRLDHCSIYIFIASSYTFFTLLGMEGRRRLYILSLSWSGAIVGCCLCLFYPTHPKYISVIIYISLGWAVIFLARSLASRNLSVLLLLAVGGVLYTTGATCYAISRPNPYPKVFGYHEVFHSFVSLAALCHYVAACIVVSRTRGHASAVR